MMNRSGYKLYKQIIDISEDYLGPATKRFIDRQIIAHIDKDPEDLTPKDVPKLIDWIEAAVSMLTNDKDLVVEYRDRLEKLTAKKS